MSKVWLVARAVPYEGTDVTAAFSSKKAADDTAAAWNAHDGDDWGEQEWIVFPLRLLDTAVLVPEWQWPPTGLTDVAEEEEGG